MARPKGSLPTNFINLEDQVFHHLTVEKYLGKTKYLCHCKCGNKTEVKAGNLRTGNTKSCGCLQSEITRQNRTKHGQSPRTGCSIEYQTWCWMKARCYNKKCRSYQDYGGRGIKVCQRWLEAFDNFFADMGPKPKKSTIERIDNQGDYTPENCRWASYKEQVRNRRNSKRIEFSSQTKLLVEWTEELGLNYKKTHRRLRDGWTVEEAFAE